MAWDDERKNRDDDPGWGSWGDEKPSEPLAEQPERSSLWAQPLAQPEAATVPGTVTCPMCSKLVAPEKRSSLPTTLLSLVGFGLLIAYMALRTHAAMPSWASPVIIGAFVVVSILKRVLRSTHGKPRPPEDCPHCHGPLRTAIEGEWGGGPTD